MLYIRENIEHHSSIISSISQLNQFKQLKSSISLQLSLQLIWLVINELKTYMSDVFIYGSIDVVPSWYHKFLWYT